ncbi:MAG: histidine kinase [Burkholderiales bacterium]|nr:histidine kinase [Burkholderiales bacterium]
MRLSKLPQPRVLAVLVPVLALNTLIALGLTLAGPYDLASNLVLSHCIGLGIWAAIEPVSRLWVCDMDRHWWRLLLIVPTGVLLGYLGGSVLARLLLDLPLDWYSLARLPYLVLSLVAGAAGTYYFISQMLLRQVRERNAAQQLHMAEARLQLLQAQLEPHMLFNTLANLRALITLDPARATAMLDRLVDFLRATLSASRQTMHPLSAEFARLQDYLELMAVRMGPRLQYTLDLPAALVDLPVPSLLLQPLVENAIRHGLEPQVAGGSIRVSASRSGNRVLLEVVDSGVGLPPSFAAATASGFGLALVREQLATAYGPQSAIELIAASAGGTCARAIFCINH